MVRFMGVIALSALAASPASSHCFARWHYPYPQPGCHVTQVHVAQLATPKPAAPVTPRPAEIANATPIPIPDLDDAQRAVGLEMLRQEIDREIKAGTYPMFKANPP